MAVNLLSDELKSGMTYIVPPVTKEKLVHQVNALVYHLKHYGICFYNTDVKALSGSDYLANLTPQNVVNTKFGAFVQEHINRLEYLTIPVNLNDIVTNLNLMYNIFKQNMGYLNSDYVDWYRYQIYANTPGLSGHIATKQISVPEYNLITKIQSLEKLQFPISYDSIITQINNYINLYKGEPRVIDANDLRLLIVALKEELSVDDIDYGNASSSQSKVDEY